MHEDTVRETGYQQHTKLTDAEVHEVRKLPIEDTLWLIDEKQNTQDEDDDMFLVMCDKTQAMVGCQQLSTCTTDSAYSDQCRRLIHTSTLHPKTGIPRRPLKLTFKDPDLAKKAVGLDVSDIGISYMYAGVMQGNVKLSATMRECSVCRLRATQQLFHKCSDCKAVLYCSETCQQSDWLRVGMESHSHKHWCNKMKSYMAQHATLANLPFTFIHETTSSEFHMDQYRMFLERQGVYNQGAWRRECLPHNCHQQCGELMASEEDPIVLPVESVTLDCCTSSAARDIVSWESYYEHRGFRLDSPIAILLQWPMTLYYIINHCLVADYGFDIVKADTVNIDILGAEREVELMPIFKEIGFLLPSLGLDICMYGNELSKSAVTFQYHHENLRIKVVRGLYHKKCSENRKPHLVIGFNAGLGAYRNWTKTLIKLKTENISTYFTDYCQYSCECAKLAMEQLGLGTIAGPYINPFRSPVRKLSTENDMPWYSNGFYFHLTYS